MADAAPHLRLVPAPDADPPYEDDLVGPVPGVDGTLALAFPPQTPPVLPLRLVPPAGRTEPPPDEPSPPLPPPRAWAARVVQVVMDVLTGARPASQLSAHASWEVLQKLERAAARLAPRPGQAIRRPLVVSVRVCLPAPGVAEASAVIDMGARRRAIALRFEARRGRWECVALEVG